MSKLRVKFLALFLFFGFLSHVCCELQYVPRSMNCQPSVDKAHLGRAIFCDCNLNFACKDGSPVGSKGQCQSWLDVCHDVSKEPTCGASQVLELGSKVNWIPSGDGKCLAGDDDSCVWKRQDWVWSCCDCPAGYTSITGGKYCGFESLSTPPCVRCSDPNQVVMGNATHGLQCAPKPTPPKTSPTPLPSNAKCALTASQKSFIKKNEGFCAKLTESGGCHRTLGS